MNPTFELEDKCMGIKERSLCSDLCRKSTYIYTFGFELRSIEWSLALRQTAYMVTVIFKSIQDLQLDELCPFVYST